MLNGVSSDKMRLPIQQSTTKTAINYFLCIFSHHDGVDSDFLINLSRPITRSNSNNYSLISYLLVTVMVIDFFLAKIDLQQSWLVFLIIKNTCKFSYLCSPLGISSIAKWQKIKINLFKRHKLKINSFEGQACNFWSKFAKGQFKFTQ